MSDRRMATSHYELTQSRLRAFSFAGALAFAFVVGSMLGATVALMYVNGG